jgi:hypothetical protein
LKPLQKSLGATLGNSGVDFRLLRKSALAFLPANPVHFAVVRAD